MQIHPRGELIVESSAKQTAFILVQTTPLRDMSPETEGDNA